MSTVDRAKALLIPHLVAGERLDAATFHERYQAMPPATRAELIGGVVHMPSPLFWDHGGAGQLVGGWLVHYQRDTPGVRGEENASTVLGPGSEVEPDHTLRIRPDHGGRTRHEGGYVLGAPELVVEVARSSRRVDLGPKKDDYERAGVGEYIVVALDPDEVFWFVLRAGRYERFAPADDGLYRSEAFPGLWLDAPALLAENLPRLFDALDLGLASPEHAAFVDRLARARVDREV